MQFAIGRLVAGLGIGALSTSVPMYQSESTPKKIRGAVVSSYQLFITLGIWLAYMVGILTINASCSLANLARLTSVPTQWMAVHNGESPMVSPPLGL